ISAGVTTMKMMSSTSMTSIIGVTFGDDCTPLPLLAAIAIGRPPQGMSSGLLRDRAAGTAGCVEFARKAAAAELTRDALDEIVDHFFRDVRHLGREIVDLRREIVVRPDCRNRDEQTERGRNKRLGDTTSD